MLTRAFLRWDPKLMRVVLLVKDLRRSLMGTVVGWSILSWDIVVDFLRVIPRLGAQLYLLTSTILEVTNSKSQKQPLKIKQCSQQNNCLEIQIVVTQSPCLPIKFLFMLDTFVESFVQCQDQSSLRD